MKHYTCLKCGKSKIEAIFMDATVYRVVGNVHNGYVEYGLFDTATDIEDGNLVRFQCSFCGNTVVDSDGEQITSEEELIELLWEGEKDEHN